MQLIERSGASYPVLPVGGEAYNEPERRAPQDSDGGLVLRLRRRKFLFAFVFLVVLALVAGAYLYLVPVYRAEASVTIVQPERVLSSQQASDSLQTTGDSSDLESQALILSSPMLIREAIARPDIQALLRQECEALQPPPWKRDARALLRLKPVPSCDTQMADTTGVVSGLRGKLGVATNGRSRVINVAYTSPLPAVAQAVANGIVQVYLDSRIREKLQPRDEALEWLRGETTRVADRLKATEAQIDTFLHANGVIRGQAAPIASEQLTSLSQQLAIAEADRATASGKLAQTRTQGTANAGVLENRAVSDVKLQLATVTAQIAQLSARYGAANPALTELQQQRRGLEGLLGRETGLVNRSAAADFQAANSRVETLQKQIEGLKLDVRGNDRATTQIASLQRDAVTDRELYVDMTKNLNQLETNRRLITANARLVSLAELPEGIFFPKMSTFALTGIMLATAFAATTALLRDRADRTVRTVEGLEGETGLRVLARVPHVPGVGQGASRLVKRMQKPSAFQEAIRTLYAECMLLGNRPRGAKPMQSIMVCSAATGEGKTFITLALAHFAVAAGQRVLILECDMRRPSIARSLQITRAEGVTDVLRGACQPQDVLITTRNGGLDVILAGSPSMNSTELLGGPAMRHLLDWATANYDLVLVDSPPSRALADSKLLAREVDGILYCAQWGHSHMANVLEGVADIRAAGGNVLGLVLDRLETEGYRLYNSNAQTDTYLVPGRG